MNAQPQTIETILQARADALKRENADNESLLVFIRDGIAAREAEIRVIENFLAVPLPNAS